MQVTCPKCDKKGLLQTITPRYHRVRHSIVTKQYGTLNGRPYNDRTFTYCRVTTDWAQQQFDAEKKREEEYLKKLFQRQ